eukprot:XP_014769773.1 PREDICTED: uncharacterized protein LOC106868846 [Octopus bimaculoides]
MKKKLIKWVLNTDKNEDSSDNDTSEKIPTDDMTPHVAGQARGIPSLRDPKRGFVVGEVLLEGASGTSDAFSNTAVVVAASVVVGAGIADVGVVNTGAEDIIRSRVSVGAIVVVFGVSVSAAITIAVVAAVVGTIVVVVVVVIIVIILSVIISDSAAAVIAAVAIINNSDSVAAIPAITVAAGKTIVSNSDIKIMQSHD